MSEMPINLTQSMTDALASFIFNVGSTAFKNSTLLLILNAKNWREAADQFLRWNKVRDPESGKMIVLPGLTRRHAEERALFLQDGVTP